MSEDYEEVEENYDPEAEVIGDFKVS